MNGINLRRFEFDLDTTWSAFFTDADLNIYSRYGGRDRGEPDGRMNTASLSQTMREVLDVHRRRGRRAGDVFQPVLEGSETTADIALLKKNHQGGCVHCHEVREFRLLESFHAGRFDRRRLFRYPLPENVGLVFDRDHGHRVGKVSRGSAAERAGIVADDVVERVGNVPVHSESDVRWALDRATDGKPIRIGVRRGAGGSSGATGRPLTLTLRPTGDWRVTDLGWRKSLRSVPFPTGMRGYSLAPSQRQELKLDDDVLAIRISAIYADGLARSVGLRKRDVVVGLPGPYRARTYQQFLGGLLSRYRPDDRVKLIVIRDRKRIVLTGRFPKWFTAETTVP